MEPRFSDAELHGYLDEALPPAAMSAIEDAMRTSEALRGRMALLLGGRDAGLHSLGEIWRRGRLTCPPRAELRSYLLGVLEAEQADYIKFHLDTIGCRVCQANFADLTRAAEPVAAAGEQTQSRRRKFFQSSAGLLRSQP